MTLGYRGFSGIQVGVNATSVERIVGSSAAPSAYAFHPILKVWVEIDPEQAWFWSEEWQAGEHEADEDLRLGRYEDFDDIDGLVDSL